MRDFIYKLMTDKLNGPVFWPFKVLLYALSLAYGLAIYARGVLYEFGVLKTHKLPLKIISVGNITLGGTGKTPFVITLSKILKESLKKDASILIRGYGWDEQALLKKSLPEVPVIVGEDRVKGAGKSIRLYGHDTAILDDGFQYWELERKVNIVLVDSRNPFGNGQLFPRGILREGKGAFRRADLVVFTKVDKAVCDIAKTRDEIRAINPRIGFLEAFHKPLYFYNARSKKAFDLSFIKGKKVVLISSIGDPAYFEDTVRQLKVSVSEHIIFGDHHDYSQADLGRIMRRLSERSFDFLVTTEKDAVKFARLSFSFGGYELFTLVIDEEITSGKEILIDRLRSLYNSKGAK